VASSFARRAETFEQELRTEPLRRSKLDEFVKSSRDAAGQLVANLHRAGELIQSFKQVRSTLSTPNAGNSAGQGHRPDHRQPAAGAKRAPPSRSTCRKVSSSTAIGFYGKFDQFFLNAAIMRLPTGGQAISISARPRGDVESFLPITGG
jgi:hypothetical protein